MESYRFSWNRCDLTGICTSFIESVEFQLNPIDFQEFCRNFIESVSCSLIHNVFMKSNVRTWIF